MLKLQLIVYNRQKKCISYLNKTASCYSTHWQVDCRSTMTVPSATAAATYGCTPCIVTSYTNSVWISNDYINTTLYSTLRLYGVRTFRSLHHHSGGIASVADLSYCNTYVSIIGESPTLINPGNRIANYDSVFYVESS